MRRRPTARNPRVSRHRSSATEFGAIERALVDADAVVGAAECHGMLCGMLCGAPGTHDALWLDQVLGEDAPDGLDVDDLRTLATRTAEALTGPDLGFAPLLPDDERPLARRVAALRDWADGFLFGFGAAAGHAFPDLPEASREFIDDLRSFARLADDPADADEAGENAYTELVEYVRVGVLTVHSECRLLDGATQRRLH